VGDLSVEEFALQFPGLFEHSTFRLESRDQYVAPNEEEPFRRFLVGRPQDLSWRQPWKDLVTAAISAGKRMERVHVVSEPWTDYVRFELTCVYPSNVAAGEDVRILPRAYASALDLVDEDFWLFDSRRAALMEYDSDGRWLSVNLVDDPEIVVRRCFWRDVALHYALPLDQYAARSHVEWADNHTQPTEGKPT
jgi:hypothetical protein